MFGKIIKIVGILALIAIFLFGAIEVWLYRNQEKLFRKVQGIVNENLNGNLEIEDFKFRPFSGGFGLNFTLANVKLTDSLYKAHHTPFLDVELLHAALDLNGLYKGDIIIKNLVLQNGSLRMFVRKDGYSNLSIFKSDSPKKDKDKKSGDKDGLIKKLGNLRFINFAVSFADSVTGKGYGALFHDASNHVVLTDSTTNANFSGSVFFNGLIFKPEKGGFLINQETNLDINLAYDEDKKILKINPSILESSTYDKIGIKGEFNFSDTIKLFKLYFNAKQIAVDNALPLLNKRVRGQLDSIGIHANVDTEVKVVGQLSPKSPGILPRVDVHFKTAPFQYTLPVGVLRKVKASGTYTNQGDTLQLPGIPNARLTASNVSGLFETIPFKVGLVVNNFINPTAVLNGSINADSTNLDQLLDPLRYRFKNGKARIDFHFDGNLKNFYDAKTDKFNGKLSGKASMKDISMDYLPRQVHLKKINGDIIFDEKAVVLPDLRFSDGQNLLYVNGRVMDLIPYLFGSPKPLRAAVNINIPSWQLNWLETLLAPRAQVTKKRKKNRRLSDLLDNAIDNVEIIAKLNSDQMKYQKFSATKVKGEFTVKNNSVNVEYFLMNAFRGGRMRFSGTMDNSGVNQLPHLVVKGQITNADVQAVFGSFNNFGQKTITDKNLKGRLSTDFSFESRLNNAVKIVPSSMKGTLSINLTNGYINNFEPFLKMKKLVFKRRNFESVQFATIKNNFRLVGEEIEIDPMEIESNVITLFIDGIYSFGKKTDINIEIPLSNLKKRDSTYVLDPNNPEKREGSKIFLRAIDENGEVNIKLAFRKKKKDKEKEK